MAEMELGEFIGNGLVQIAKGIRQANAELKDEKNQQWEVFNLRHNKGDSSKIPGVRFDIAITASAQQKEKVGLFVAIASIGGGVGAEQLRGDEKFHRIQFEVGIENTWK